MQESISFCLSILLWFPLPPFIMTPKSQQEIGWPPIHSACCGGPWQISTLQKCWISMDVCLIKPAWPFPDLANWRLWYNGTFIRLSDRDSFSSDLLFSVWCTNLFHYYYYTMSYSHTLSGHASLWNQIKVSCTVKLTKIQWKIHC